MPGDIVRLSAGDLVPADGQLLEARDLYVQQAALTGNPCPPKKRCERVDKAEEKSICTGWHERRLPSPQGDNVLKSP